MKGRLLGNVSMAVSKVLSGFNENALKFLLPRWMSWQTGVALRLGFGAVMFWLMWLFGHRRYEKAKPSRRDILLLLLTGGVCMWGYMFGLLGGLTYTTPVSSALFISLEPVITFLLCVAFFKEKVTRMKVAGIALGLGGALVCILTQRTSAVAPKPLLGDMLCLVDALCYSLFLVITGRFLQRLGNVTVSKWTFTGGAIVGIPVALLCGWDAPVLSQGVYSAPFLMLLFVLVFPTTVCYLLVDIGLKRLSTTVVALYGYVILIVATVMSYIMGQDIFSWWQMLAIAMIVASVYFVEVAERRTTALATKGLTQAAGRAPTQAAAPAPAQPGK